MFRLAKENTFYQLEFAGMQELPRGCQTVREKILASDQQARAILVPAQHVSG
jgi:hypothetical protein